MNGATTTCAENSKLVTTPAQLGAVLSAATGWPMATPTKTASTQNSEVHSRTVTLKLANSQAICSNYFLKDPSALNKLDIPNITKHWEPMPSFAARCCCHEVMPSGPNPDITVREVCFHEPPCCSCMWKVGCSAFTQFCSKQSI